MVSSKYVTKYTANDYRWTKYICTTETTAYFGWGPKLEIETNKEL